MRRVGLQPSEPTRGSTRHDASLIGWPSSCMASCTQRAAPFLPDLAAPSVGIGKTRIGDSNAYGGA